MNWKAVWIGRGKHRTIGQLYYCVARVDAGVLPARAVQCVKCLPDIAYDDGRKNGR